MSVRPWREISAPYRRHKAWPYRLRDRAARWLWARWVLVGWTLALVVSLAIWVALAYVAVIW